MCVVCGDLDYYEVVVVFDIVVVMVEYEVFGCMFGYDYEDVVFWYVECVY